MKTTEDLKKDSFSPDLPWDSETHAMLVERYFSYITDDLLSPYRPRVLIPYVGCLLPSRHMAFRRLHRLVYNLEKGITRVDQAEVTVVHLINALFTLYEDQCKPWNFVRVLSRIGNHGVDWHGRIRSNVVPEAQQLIAYLDQCDGIEYKDLFKK